MQRLVTADAGGWRCCGVSKVLGWEVSVLARGKGCDTRLRGGGGDMPASGKRFPSLTLLLNLNLKVNEQS